MDLVIFSEGEAEMAEAELELELELEAECIRRIVDAAIADGSIDESAMAWLLLN